MNETFIDFIAAVCVRILLLIDNGPFTDIKHLLYLFVIYGKSRPKLSIYYFLFV